MKRKKASEYYCLGIESTADDFSVGISTFEGEILANIISAYVPEEGGIHPREAARHHAEAASKVLEEVFTKSGIRPQDLSVIAFSQGPGLGPCLRTGATVARALVSHLKVPLVGVNHCIAHIEIGKLKTGAKDPITLYVSGGNTIVAAFDSGRYRVLAKHWTLPLETVWTFLQEKQGYTKRKVCHSELLLKNLPLKGRNSFLCHTQLKAWTHPSADY